MTRADPHRPRRPARFRPSPRGSISWQRFWQPPDALDLDGHRVSIVHRHAGFAEEAHPLRGAGGDDIAGFERECPGAVRDQRGHAVDDLVGAVVLHQHVVVPAPDAQVARVPELVRGDHHRAHGAERVERLGPHELLVDELQVPGADVVDAGVAEHIVERIGLVDAPRVASDHDAQLRLEVHGVRELRIPLDDGVWSRRPRSGTSRRASEARCGTPPLVLLGVGVVVQTDCDDLARVEAPEPPAGSDATSPGRPAAAAARARRAHCLEGGGAGLRAVRPSTPATRRRGPTRPDATVAVLDPESVAGGIDEGDQSHR